MKQPLLAMSVVVLASGLSAQHRRDHDRVAKAQVTEERLLRWGEAGIPELPDELRSLGLQFSGDGQWLAIQVEEALVCVELATAKATALRCVPGLCGSVSGPRVYTSSPRGLRIVTLPGGAEEVLVAAKQPRPGGRPGTFHSADLEYWLLAPGGDRAVSTLSGRIHDFRRNAISLASRKAGGAIVASNGCAWWATWDSGSGNLALALAEPGKQTIAVVDRNGVELASFVVGATTMCELDPTGSYVWWVDTSLCRGDLRDGSVTKANGPEQYRFWQVDPVLGIGLDGNEFCLWNLTDLEPVKRVAIDGGRPADEDPAGSRVDAAPPSPRVHYIGAILMGVAAASQHRDRIALATQHGVRIYRVQN